MVPDTVCATPANGNATRRTAAIPNTSPELLPDTLFNHIPSSCQHGFTFAPDDAVEAILPLVRTSGQAFFATFFAGEHLLSQPKRRSTEFRLDRDIILGNHGSCQEREQALTIDDKTNKEHPWETLTGQ
jgi:hypothetical protein